MLDDDGIVRNTRQKWSRLNQATAKLNRAVAAAKRDGSDAGIAIIDAVSQRGELIGYHLAHSTRGEAARSAEGISAFEQAQGLSNQEPKRRRLMVKLRNLRKS
jgi:RNA polymerase sigma-70 factor (ECF subfamily)